MYCYQSLMSVILRWSRISNKCPHDALTLRFSAAKEVAVIDDEITKIAGKSRSSQQSFCHAVNSKRLLLLMPLPMSNKGLTTSLIMKQEVRDGDGRYINNHFENVIFS